ncbi:hypothetical protein BD309DRAFT_971344 [Dichomitus squalens]|nr:hypothetical protein BD309DRAFT_971344 [Dichomitus squalens]
MAHLRSRRLSFPTPIFASGRLESRPDSVTRSSHSSHRRFGGRSLAIPPPFPRAAFHLSLAHLHLRHPAALRTPHTPTTVMTRTPPSVFPCRYRRQQPSSYRNRQSATCPHHPSNPFRPLGQSTVPSLSPPPSSASLLPHDAPAGPAASPNVPIESVILGSLPCP